MYAKALVLLGESFRLLSYHRWFLFLRSFILAGEGRKNRSKVHHNDLWSWNGIFLCQVSTWKEFEMGSCLIFRLFRRLLVDNRATVSLPICYHGPAESSYFLADYREENLNKMITVKMRRTGTMTCLHLLTTQLRFPSSLFTKWGYIPLEERSFFRA